MIKLEKLRIRRPRFWMVLVLLLWACNEAAEERRVSEITPSVKQPGDSISFRPDLQSFFAGCKVEGSITIFDINNKTWILSDTADAEVQTFPASTFKIINLLIALESGAIKNEKEIIKWKGNVPDTALYGYRPEIYHDMTVKQAFTVSAGWVFAELAQRIGEEKYRRFLKIGGYGNQSYSSQGLDFWNFGPLQISPKNQVAFLVNVYKETLPFAKQNYAILKSLMVTDSTNNYVIRSKTGWTRWSGKEIGWWIGYIESKGDAYVFATRITKSFSRKSYNSGFGECRKSITKAVFKELRIME